MNEERRMEHTLDKLLKLWPIAAVIVAGITAYVQLQISVSSVRSCPADIKALADRVIVLETQSSLMERYRARRER